jgi:PAS domain S-box-containing protein
LLSKIIKIGQTLVLFGDFFDKSEMSTSCFPIKFISCSGKTGCKIVWMNWKKVSPTIRIPLIYVLVGGLWILLSDWLFDLWIEDPELMRVTQTHKGWFFVGVTGLLLALLVNRMFSTQEKTKRAYTEALEESEMKLSTLLSNLPGMAFRCRNDKHWTMLFVSKGCEDLTGYAVEELENSTLLSYVRVIHPDDRRKVRDGVQEKVVQKEKYYLTYRIITKSGEIKWVLEQGQGVFGPKGDLQYIEGFISDISEQKSAERSLRYYADFLNVIIESIPFPLFYKDPAGRYLGCNKAFCQLVGKSLDEIIGQTVYDMFSLAQARRFMEKNQEILETRESQHLETKVELPDGKHIYVVMHKAVFLNPDGHPGGIIGVYFDISDRVRAETIILQQMEELERVNDELDRFTYSVSHDLRSPLVTVEGFLGLIRDDARSGNLEDMESNVKRAFIAIEKMHKLLEDLLRLSRLGKVTDPFEKISMNEVVFEVLEHLHGLISRNGCTVHLDPNLPEVFADRTRIMVVLQNLVENAIKFKAADRPLRIRIGADTSNESPVFFVKDNGIGIDPNHQPGIFNLFSKLDSRTEGTGLGLTLVERIIRMHGGKIWVESEGEGKGSCFYFSLSSKDPKEED